MIEYRIEFYDENIGEWELICNSEDYFSIQKELYSLKETNPDNKYRLLEIKEIG